MNKEGGLFPNRVRHTAAGTVRPPYAPPDH